MASLDGHECNNENGYKVEWLTLSLEKVRSSSLHILVALKSPESFSNLFTLIIVRGSETITLTNNDMELTIRS